MARPSDTQMGVFNFPEQPTQLVYHGPLAEDQTISGDRVQQSKTVAGTLVTVPLLTTDVATTLTVLLPNITFAKPVGQGGVVPPVDFQTVAITTTRVIPTQRLNVEALSLKGTASHIAPVIVMDSSNLLSMGRADHSEISPPRRWPERVPETALPLARASSASRNAWRFAFPAGAVAP